ncbi:MAG: hypothetical protein AAF787_20970 [Chloroflexota bacterium]
MAYEIKQIDNAPIWVATYTEPYNAIVDAGAVDAEMTSITAGMEGPIYYIPDLRATDVNFGQIVEGMAAAFQPGVKSFYNDPRVKILTVGTNELIKMATVAAASKQYGEIDIQIFATPEEAIAHAQAEIAAS